MRGAILLHLTLLVASCWVEISIVQESGKAVERNDAGIGLKDGWRHEVEIPEVKRPSGDAFLRPAKIGLWVEQRWLCVRRTDADGAIEWQVVLAQPIADTVPAIETDKHGGLSVAFGHYFIRENLGRVRVLRQRKNVQAPAWPKLEMNDPIETRFGAAGMTAKLVELKGFLSGGWCWIASGLANDRPDIWLRLERQELWKPGRGFEGGPTIPARAFFGNHHVIDEGDLFVATRSTVEASERALAALKLRETLGTKPAPAIAASKWFNTPEAPSVEKLRGKVVLLDFWGTWCGPCVEKLPAVEAIHKKYGERGLIVIGVHSEQAGDSVAEFLAKKPLSFPIAVDTGETATSYGVNSWPIYFLIDKSGKAHWGFSSSPPTDSQIEELLR